MSQQRTEFQRPVHLQIDYNQGVWQAYLNCINSFQQPDFMSENIPQAGIMRSASKVSIERYTFNVQSLYAQIKDTDRAKGKIEKLEIKKDPFEAFHKIGECLHELGFFKQPRRISHL